MRSFLVLNPGAGVLNVLVEPWAVFQATRQTTAHGQLFQTPDYPLRRKVQSKLIPSLTDGANLRHSAWFFVILLMPLNLPNPYTSGVTEYPGIARVHSLGLSVTAR